MRSMLIFSVFLFLASSCGKSPKGHSDENPLPDEDDVEFPMQPLVLGKSVSQGAAVTASIGSAGGPLATADGHVRINVPAGAVKTNTTFSKIAEKKR